MKNNSFFQRLGALLNQYGFYFFTLAVAILGISWPQMTSSGNWPLHYFLIYYFSLWLILVMLLLISGITGEDNDPNKDD